jgi:hypothetical protein
MGVNHSDFRSSSHQPDVALASHKEFVLWSWCRLLQARVLIMLSSLSTRAFSGVQRSHKNDREDFVVLQNRIWTEPEIDMIPLKHLCSSRQYAADRPPILQSGLRKVKVENPPKSGSKRPITYDESQRNQLGHRTIACFLRSRRAAEEKSDSLPEDLFKNEDKACLEKHLIPANPDFRKMCRRASNRRAQEAYP